MEKFKAEIKKIEAKNGAYVEIPFDVEKVYNSKRVKVKATFDDYEYRGSIVSMGGCYIIGITKDIRNRIQKEAGDIIDVTIEKDEEERVVNPPEELLDKINSDKEIGEFWNSLSFSMRRKCIMCIESAKKEETRLKRIDTTIEKLKNKEKL
ncbi:MAG: YdeI/OmpD-associated family protein [Paraclostridium sp.]